MNAKEGATVDLHCIFKASPAPRVHWTRAGSKLHENDKYKIHMHPHEKHHHNMTTLRIKDVNKDDLGQYECHAENGYGKQKAAVTLIYEPEKAILNECKLTDDNLHTAICNWTVHSAQPVSEAILFFKQTGERKWQQDAASSAIVELEDNKWE